MMCEISLPSGHILEKIILNTQHKHQINTLRCDTSQTLSDCNISSDTEISANKKYKPTSKNSLNEEV